MEFAPLAILLELLETTPLGRYREGHVTVYALIDPRDQTARYIGISRVLDQRIVNHRSGSTPSTRDWNAELNQAGLCLDYVVIGQCRHHEWAQVEVEWIKRLRLAGYKLHNRHPGGRYETQADRDRRQYRHAQRAAGRGPGAFDWRRARDQGRARRA